ncbi:MAG: UDP-3-O-acyl-N-acetylglucosamine deacetylase, partial [Proteobacteria bacterium]
LGLALGGSLDNAVVLDEANVLNPEGLRYPDEFARHKVLDSLGDFKLAGIPIQAKFKMHRAGHDLHKQILLEIFKDPSNYEIVEGSPETRAVAQTKVAAVSSLRAAI